MTTWVLVVIMHAASNAATPLTIPNLPSYQECVRVEQVIRTGAIGDYHTYGRWVSQCIEVHTAK